MLCECGAYYVGKTKHQFPTQLPVFVSLFVHLYNYFICILVYVLCTIHSIHCQELFNIMYCTITNFIVSYIHMSPLRSCVLGDKFICMFLLICLVWHVPCHLFHLVSVHHSHTSLSAEDGTVTMDVPGRVCRLHMHATHVVVFGIFLWLGYLGWHLSSAGNVALDGG